MAQLRTVEIIPVLQEITKDANLKVAVMGSVSGAGIVGVSAFVGGLIGGRLGVALGGLVGSVTALGIMDEFQSVPAVIAKMSPKEQNQLVQSVRPYIQSAGIASGSALLTYVVSHESVKAAIINAICTFFMDVMKMKVES